LGEIRIPGLLAQVQADAVTALERIAVAQVIMAAVMLLIGLVVAGAAVVAVLQLRALQRGVRQQLEQLRPLTPLITRAAHLSSDMAGMTDTVRRRVDDALHTLEELRRSVERGGAAAEERVRRFAAVLDVVQAETEELMLDAAATARGVHETARVLRESARRERSTPRDDEEEGA
jgi:hypothetical protein